MSLRARLQDRFLDLLFPPRCALCGRHGSFLCPSCIESLPRLLPPRCPSCGLPLLEGGRCLSCAGRPSALEGIRSLFFMEGPVRELVHALKYHNQRALAAPLSRLMGRFLQEYPLPVSVLVPVPLHPRRLRERGYNQSALLARALSQISALPFLEHCLVREKDSPPQARAASREERRHNVEGAFACCTQRLKGERVLLIDDVCTSGATLEACAQALQDAGATSAWALTLARER